MPYLPSNYVITVYPKKYAHSFCFAVLCCGYTLTDFPISIRLTSLALWQSNDCPSASKATLMNMDKYFMWIHYERLHNHNKAKHNKTMCIFLGIYCSFSLNVAITLTLTFQGGIIQLPCPKNRLSYWYETKAWISWLIVLYMILTNDLACDIVYEFSRPNLEIALSSNVLPPRPRIEKEMHCLDD